MRGLTGTTVEPEAELTKRGRRAKRAASRRLGGKEIRIYDPRGQELGTAIGPKLASGGDTLTLFLSLGTRQEEFNWNDRIRNSGLPTFDTNIDA
jgi:hypothetical protein